MHAFHIAVSLPPATTDLLAFVVLSSMTADRVTGFVIDYLPSWGDLLLRFRWSLADDLLRVAGATAAFALALDVIF